MEEKYDVAYCPCADYEYNTVKTALETVIDRTLPDGRLRPGMRAALKLNLVAGAEPEKAATVHPTVVLALKNILTQRGLMVVAGDSPGGPFSRLWVERIYAACGLAELREQGLVLNEDFEELHIDKPAGAICHAFDCTAYLKKADIIINVCKLKTHGMMTQTSGVKNMFGSIPGTKKQEQHFRYARHEDFADMLVDLYEYFSPALTICDAVVAMEGNGPTAGRPRKAGYLAAAVNAHALDESLARLIGAAPAEIPTLAAASRRGLLPRTPRIWGEPSPILDFEKPRASGLLFEGQGKGLSVWRSRLFAAVFRTRPRLTRKRCVGCAQCARVCPAKAIVMKDGCPVINRKSCIRCFCCQEFCPQGALYVHRSAVARWLQ